MVLLTRGGGNASMMTQMMAPVLAAQGIDLEEVFLAEKHIEYCVGCGAVHGEGQVLATGRPWGHHEAGARRRRGDPRIARLFQARNRADEGLSRSLPGLRAQPRTSWKPGLAISVSAGMAETATAGYLASLLRVYGAFPVATFTAIAWGPAVFSGKDSWRPGP